MKYNNVSLHEDLIKQIDDYIKKSKLAFRSRAELITFCIREFLTSESNKKK